MYALKGWRIRKKVTDEASFSLVTSLNYDRIRKWIEAAAQEPVSPDPEDFNLEGFDEDALGVLIRDLDGVNDSTISIQRALSALVLAPPHAATLQSILIDIDVDMAHANHHWNLLVEMLRSLDEWFEDDDQLD